MHVYIVFAHPSRNSFTWEVMQAFELGLRDAGHSAEIGDLYEMDFRAEMDLAQYERETGPDPEAPVPADVRREHEKIEAADAVVFIYPVWWSDCPAKLKGWFDRVLTFGYAYLRGGTVMLQKPASLEKVLVLCPAGHTVEDLEEQGIARAMRTIMIEDRVPGLGAKVASMEILGGMSTGDETARGRNLKRAYELGRKFWQPSLGRKSLIR